MMRWLGIWGLCVVAHAQPSVLMDIQSIDQSLTTVRAQLLQQRAQRKIAERQLQDMQAAQVQMQDKAQAAKQAFERRLRVLAKRHHPAQWVTQQLGASIEQHQADQRLLHKIAAHDKALQLRYVRQRDALLELQRERELHQEDLKQQIELTERLQKELEEKRRARKQLLASIQEQPKQRDRWTQEAVSAARTLQDVVQRTPLTPRAKIVAPLKPASPFVAPTGSMPRNQARLQITSPTGSIHANKGQLPWPAVGPLRIGFGDRTDLAYGTVTAHHGWDIGAPHGTSVQAIAAGHVVFADWLRGYGQVVIVDHDQGFHAVVAHLSQVDVRAGEKIEAGRVLGAVGDTGSLRGSVLYFELRHRGTPVDPKAWLRP